MSHHIDKEFSGVAHCHAQRLPWRSELRGHRRKLSAWWGTRCSCRKMWWLRGQARGAVHKTRPIGYRVGVGTAVAHRAADASFTRGSHWALTWCPVAPDVWFAPTATRFSALILATVRTAAPCEQKKRAKLLCKWDVYLKKKKSHLFLIGCQWHHEGSADPVCRRLLGELHD